MNAVSDLRRIRFRLNMSQLEFGTALGMSKDQIVNREHGRSPWRNSEIDTAKIRLKLYLESQFKERTSLLGDWVL